MAPWLRPLFSRYGCVITSQPRYATSRTKIKGYVCFQSLVMHHTHYLYILFSTVQTIHPIEFSEHSQQCSSERYPSHSSRPIPPPYKPSNTRPTHLLAPNASLPRIIASTKLRLSCPQTRTSSTKYHPGNHTVIHFGIRSSPNRKT